MSGWDDALTAIHEDTSGSDHPIDVASRNAALSSLKQHLADKAGTILEIGCSSGYLLPLVRKEFPRAAIMGADVVKLPLLKLAEAMPDLPLLRFDLTHCPLPDQCVDALVMLNVLEHIEREDAALSQVYRILKPGGILVIEVPAGPSLYDYYDQYLRHYRRYDRSALVAACKHAGLEALEVSHLGFWVYPPFWAVKKMHRMARPRSTQEIERSVMRQISKSGSSRLIHLAMRFETLLAERLSVRYPAGIRCTGVFRKRISSG
jgi:ubiquinone/menaquinone biosynthesis C-methylase UbiE